MTWLLRAGQHLESHSGQRFPSSCFCAEHLSLNSLVQNPILVLPLPPHPPSPLGAADGLQTGAHGQTPHRGPLLHLMDPCFAAQVNISCRGPCAQRPSDQKLPPANKTLPQPERCESLHTPGRSPSHTDSVHWPRSLGPHESHTPTAKIQIPLRLRARTQYTCHPEMVSTLSPKTQPLALSSSVHLPGTPGPPTSTPPEKRLSP